MEDEIRKHTKNIFHIVSGPSATRLKKIYDILIEIVIIVAAVTISIALNNRNDHRKEIAAEKTALHAIKNEVERNYSEVTAKSKYHQILQDGINGNPDTVNLRILPSVLRESAWQMANNTKSLANIPYELQLHLASIYAIQSQYNEIWRSSLQVLYLNNIYPPTAKTRKEFLSGWLPMIQDLTTIEQQLMSEYSILLPQIENPKDKK